MYFGNHKITERYGLHAEVQFRRNDIVDNAQQVLLRTGIDYYTKANNRFTVGYAYVKTYPYGDFPVPNAFPEHRLWEQFLTSQNLGKVRLSHRYRLEQRMIGNASTGKFENGRYENRFRYMAKASINITKGNRPVFAAFYDEIFINFGKEVAYNIFDQNRLYAALGCTISPSLTLEAGYLYQMVQLRGLDVSTTPRIRIENNHTLQLAFFSSMQFMSKD